MIKIGITGSLASGKTTASKILSKNRGPLFSADIEVKELYKRKSFKSLLKKKFGLENNRQIKKSIRRLVLKNKRNLKKLEKIIHPLVRGKMRKFISKNKNKKILFFEIPLLIESKLMKYFNVLIFIKAKEKLRLRRFMLKKGDKKLFKFLNNQQIIDKHKTKFCDHVVVNDNNLYILKKKLLHIISNYE